MMQLDGFMIYDFRYMIFAVFRPPSSETTVYRLPSIV